jgi:hypothetical protein
MQWNVLEILHFTTDISHVLVFSYVIGALVYKHHANPLI